MAFSRTDWVERKIGIAERLSRNECGGSYSEAVLILCAVISALAADAWPGKGIDRVRFIELLVSLTPQTKIVSVPFLIWQLRKGKRHVYEKRLRRKFLPLTGSEIVTARVDREVREILSICPRLRDADLRRFSYATLLYEELRSPMSHEYKPGEKTSSFPMTDAVDCPVSYVNWIHDRDRHIYFHIPWLVGLAREAGRRADAECKNYPLTQPARWWVRP